MLPQYGRSACLSGERNDPQSQTPLSGDVDAAGAGLQPALVRGQSGAGRAAPADRGGADGRSRQRRRQPGAPAYFDNRAGAAQPQPAAHQRRRGRHAAALQQSLLPK